MIYIYIYIYYIYIYISGVRTPVQKVKPNMEILVVSFSPFLYIVLVRAVRHETAKSVTKFRVVISI